MDRNLFPLLVPDIKVEYGFSLGEMGLLASIFTLGVGLGGIPAAYLLDRYSTKTSCWDWPRCRKAVHMGDRLGVVRAAVVQAASVFLDREQTVDKTVSLIEEAGRMGTQVAVFPESFVPTHP